MLPPFLRLMLATLAAWFGGGKLVGGDAIEGALWTSAAVLLVWGYFRVGSVWLALAAYRTGNVERMRVHVECIRWPSLLSPRYRGYYHWLQGVGLAVEGRMAPARDHLLQARRWRFRTENDRSIMECQLADMAVRCGDPAQAWKHLREARTLRHHPTVDALIAHVEASIPADLH